MIGGATLVLDRISSRGGADRYALELARLLAGAGVPIHLLHGHDDGSATDLPHLARSATRIASLADRFDAPRHEAAAARLRAEIQSRGSDVVLVQNVMAPRLLRAALEGGGSVALVQDHRAFCPARGKVLPDGAPCGDLFGSVCDVCFTEGDHLDVARRDLRLQTVVARLEALASARRIVVLSRYMAAELATAGMEPGRIRVVPPVAPQLAEPRPLPGAGHVAIVGRLSWQKGSRAALQALVRTPHVARLTFFGDGPAREELEEEARALGSPPAIEVTGWLAQEALHARLGDVDVVAVPSLWAEPFGMAGLEAAALGRPVVAYAVGGVEEWLEDGQTGILAPPARPDRFAAATASLLAHRRAAAALAARAATLLPVRFSLDRFREGWERILGGAAG